MPHDRLRGDIAAGCQSARRLGVKETPSVATVGEPLTGLEVLVERFWRRTLRCSGLGLAMLAPAADRKHSVLSIIISF
jgi:hypothetical protein